jgi:hypothetical protein
VCSAEVTRERGAMGARVYIAQEGALIQSREFARSNIFPSADFLGEGE